MALASVSDLAFRSLLGGSKGLGHCNYASPAEPALSLSNGDGTTCRPARRCRVTLNSKLFPRYAALYLLKEILINKIVEATVTFRVFEGIGVVRGCEHPVLVRKKEAGYELLGELYVMELCLGKLWKDFWKWISSLYNQFRQEPCKGAQTSSQRTQSGYFPKNILSALPTV